MRAPTGASRRRTRSRRAGGSTSPCRLHCSRSCTARSARQARARGRATFTSAPTTPRTRTGPRGRPSATSCGSTSRCTLARCASRRPRSLDRCRRTTAAAMEVGPSWGQSPGQQRRRRLHRRRAALSRRAAAGSPCASRRSPSSAHSQARSAVRVRCPWSEGASRLCGGRHGGAGRQGRHVRLRGDPTGVATLRELGPPPRLSRIGCRTRIIRFARHDR
mmetsp:Transcript_73669/g.195997  ORF Transcript_73669/g.195997 Transcript_73669/m.195997 type:complete len:219 (+) Transcript_73669:1008-1664(+)